MQYAFHDGALESGVCNVYSICTYLKHSDGEKVSYSLIAISSFFGLCMTTPLVLSNDILFCFDMLLHRVLQCKIYKSTSYVWFPHKTIGKQRGRTGRRNYPSIRTHPAGSHRLQVVLPEYSICLASLCSRRIENRVRAWDTDDLCYMERAGLPFACIRIQTTVPFSLPSASSSR